jgi:hypothetical protein
MTLILKVSVILAKAGIRGLKGSAILTKAKPHKLKSTVNLANAGIHSLSDAWIPDFAGMTV